MAQIICSHSLIIKFMCKEESPFCGLYFADVLDEILVIAGRINAERNKIAHELLDLHFGTIKLKSLKILSNFADLTISLFQYTDLLDASYPDLLDNIEKAYIGRLQEALGLSR